jgi:hypothetical protein
MQINWCLKGIPRRDSFGDAEALAVLSDNGIQSSWLFNNGSLPLSQATVVSQDVLSISALDNHVNNFASVAGQTAYISLSAGCWEFAGAHVPARRYPALMTAVDFATNYGTNEGYIFRCWVVTAPQISAAIPGLADEVRDLNLFSSFTYFHNEGEVAAKLLVPRRQIQWVYKVDRSGQPSPIGNTGSPSVTNSDFINPETVSNIIPELF